jgi:TRAP transporter TAXI family solute receptor
MKGRTVVLLCVVLLLVVAGCAAPAPSAAPKADEKMSFSIATGGTGGTWYPLGGAIGSVVTAKVANTEATAESTTAAVDNMKLLTAGKVGLAFVDDYQVGLVNNGKLTAVSDQKLPVKLVMPFYEQPLHVVTKDGTGITKLADLKGKRVSTGAPNSGTEVLAGHVLSGIGIDWGKDISREMLSASESVGALKDSKIDAFFWSGSAPTSSLIDLASTPGLKMVLLPIAGDDAAKITGANPGVFHKVTIPKGTYSGVDADIETLSTATVLAAMDTFPADRLEQIVGAIFDNKAEIAAVWKGAANLTPESSMSALSADLRPYLHPGAEKYFKAKGALK